MQSQDSWNESAELGGSEPLVLSLSDVRAQDPSLVGAKAARLAELTQQGFLVPEGSALTVHAWRHYLSENQLAQSSSPGRALEARLPDAVRRCLAQLHRKGPGAAWAVRSSGTVEDGERASFAGQYESLLNVRDIDGLCQSVIRCWASAFSERALDYARKHGIHDAPAMGVLVQRMVSPRAAGVAFTMNPVTGARDEVLVNAVTGLGERLVSGSCTPSQWLVRGDHTECVAESDRAITAEQALAVARLALRAERVYGAPQDIEWAIDEAGVHLLQTRPVSTAHLGVEPVPVALDVPTGFWERNTAYFPEPLSPMVSSFLLDAMNRAYRRFFAELGALAECMESREIGGWVYMRAIPLGGRDRSPPPRLVMRLLVSLHPGIRARVAQAARVVHDRVFDRYVDRWASELRPSLKANIIQLRDTDRKALSVEQLADHLKSAVDFLYRAVELHFLVVGAHFLALAEFHFDCEDWLGWSDAEVMRLFVGLSEKSTEPARKLAELAEQVRARADVMAQLAAAPSARLDLPPDLRASFDDYQREYGCRALRYEVAEPTLSELPQLTAQLLKEQVLATYHADERARRQASTRERAVIAARERLASRSPERCRRFETLLKHAQRAYPLREDNEFFTLSAPLALVRYALLEVGERLVESKVLASRDHVFFLRLPEALEALRSGRPQHERVLRRRGERVWIGAHPGPASYGQARPIPTEAPGLPSEAAFILKAGLWMRDRGFAPEASGRKHSAASVHEGIAASSGTYTGPARIVLRESEFGKLQQGDVLICPITSPVWSVLFPKVGALVTETGGVLSHSAIIAREYDIPSVVAVPGATSYFRDGQLVTVDGNAGTVRAVERPS
jgi:rifampicin phosphotransferase